MVKGYDPISMTDKDSLKEWLSDSEDNIVIFIDDMKSLSAERSALCLKKSYFLNPHMNDIYKKCVIENNALMVKETYTKTTDYRNIGFYMNKYLMIDNKEFIDTLKKGRVFDLKEGGLINHQAKEYIKILKNPKLTASQREKYQKLLQKYTKKDKGVEFISQEALELSQFELKPDNMEIIKKKIVTMYPNFHPIPGQKFIVSSHAQPGAPSKKYSGVQFPTVSDASLGQYIEVEVYSNENADVKNIPYKEQVYFDNVIATALYDYSFQWDGAINWYLRQGEEYFNSAIYKEKSVRYGDPDFIMDRLNAKFSIHSANTIAKIKKLLSDFKIEYDQQIIKKKADLKKQLPRILTKMDKENWELSIKNVKDHILQIDKCFMEYAPRVTTDMAKKYYYRGMTQKYKGHDKVGGEFIVDNFGSISESDEVAKVFGLRQVPTKPDGTRCCFYRINLEKGMPYVNMINTTKFKGEVEILLPRNIKFKLKKITEKEEVIPAQTILGVVQPEIRFKYNIHDISVSMIKKDQFKIETGCKKYGVVQLSLSDNPKLSSSEIKSAPKSKNPDVVSANKINKALDPVVHKIKLPRCPKGTNRDPKSGKFLTKEQKQLQKKEPKKSVQKKTAVGNSNDNKSIIKKAIKNNRSVVFNQTNPKNKSSNAFARYEKYKVATKMADIYKLGGNMGDIMNDYSKGYLTLVGSSD